jgi:hypothetical protein
MGPTVHLAVGLRLLVMLAVLVAACILVMRMLRRPRRRGTTPHCARCDYNLTGLTSECCPECGAEMTAGSIVYGELVRRPWGKVLAGVIVVVLLVPAARWAWSYDWYRVRPAAWVLSDLQSSNPAFKSRAWSEIDRRDRAGLLSKSQESRLIDICLTEQAAPSPTIAMIDHLGPCLLAGRMSPSQQATFFKQFVQPQLWVRPRVIAGAELLPIRFVARTRGPSGLWGRLERDGVARLDGQATRRPQGWRPALICRGVSGGGYYDNVILFSEWDEKARPGVHSLGITVQIEVCVDGSSGRPDDPSGRLYRAEVPLKAEFEVLATEPADYVRLIDDPSLKGALQTAIRPTKPRFDPHIKGAHFELEFRNVPVGVAFDSLIRVGGREQNRSTVCIAKGESLDWSLSATDVPVSQPFDLILRTNKVVAVDTVDLFEIWQGELVYPNLRMQTGGQPSSSPGAD